MARFFALVVLERTQDRQVRRFVPPGELGVLLTAGVEAADAPGGRIIQLYSVSDAIFTMDCEGEEGSLVLPSPGRDVSEAHALLVGDLLEDDVACAVIGVAGYGDVRTAPTPRESLNLGDHPLLASDETQKSEVVTHRLITLLKGFTILL